jgi:hypothetical protein
MSPEVSDLLKRALALPADERAALANTLLDTLDGTNESVSIQGMGCVSGASNSGPEGGQSSDRSVGRTASRDLGHGE